MFERPELVDDALNQWYWHIQYLQNERTGLWRTILDDPESYEEVSASAGIAAAMVLKGNPLHIKYINKAITGILENISEDGKVMNVSGGTAVMKDREGYRSISKRWIQGWGQGMALAFFGNGFASITWSLVSSLAPMRLIGLTGGVFNFVGGLGGITVPLVKNRLALMAAPLKLREMVANGDLGEIRMVELQYTHGFNATDVGDKTSEGQKWRVDPKIAGPSFVLGDLSTHTFYMSELICPKLKVKQVLCDRQSFIKSRAPLEDMLMDDVWDDSRVVAAATRGKPGGDACSAKGKPDA